MATIFERFKSRLTTGKREREQQQQQQTVQTPEQIQTPIKNQSSENLQSALSSGIASGVKAIDTTGIAQRQLEDQIEPIPDITGIAFEPKPPDIAAVREQLEAARTKFIPSPEFTASQGTRGTIKAIIGGTEYVLTPEEYNRISFAEGGIETPRTEMIKEERRIYQALFMDLQETLKSEILAEGKSRLHEQALAELAAIEKKAISIEDAQVILKKYDIDLPPNLALDLGVTGSIVSGTSAQVAATTARATLTSGATALAGPFAIGVFITTTLGQMTLNKNKNVNFARDINSRINEQIMEIDGMVASGAFTAQQGVDAVADLTQLTLASEIILKTEQDKFLGKQLTSVDSAMVDVQNTLNFKIPAMQNKLQRTILS
jgi:hypothetical protein